MRKVWPRCVALAPVVVFTLSGLLLRAYRPGTQSLWIDEAASITIARSIWRHGYPLLSTGQTEWSGVAFHYLLAPFVGLAGDFHVAGRLPSVLFGTLCIPVVYCFGRRFSGSRGVAWMGALLVAVSGYEIAWSRQVRFYALLQFLLAGGLCIVPLRREELSVRRVLAWLFVALLAIATHRAGYLLLLWGAAGLFFIFLDGIRSGTAMPKRRGALSLMALACVLLLVFFLPSGRCALREALRPSGLNYAGPYGLFLWTDLKWLTVFAVVGLVAGMLARPRKVLVLVVPSVLFLLVLTFQTELFAFRYLLPVYPVFFWLAAYGLVAPVERLEGLFFGGRFRCGKALVWLLAACVALALPWNKRVFPAGEYWLGRTVPQPDWRVAYEQILEREEKLRALGLRDGESFAVVSALPMLDALYLADAKPDLHYMPVTFSGLPTDQHWLPAYTRAEPVRSLDELHGIPGYLVLDDFGMLMLLDREMQEYLARRKPNALIRGRGGEHNIFIWVLPGMPP